MPFFPPDPEMPEEPDVETEGDPRWAAPFAEMPRVLPISTVVARTDTVAIAVLDARVYRNGVELRIERKLRRGALTREEWQEASSIFAEYMHAGATLGGRLRYGLEFGDGTRIVDDRPYLHPEPPELGPDDHTVTRTGGGGGGGSHSYAFSDALWVWPLPPAEEIALVVQWPSLGIPETTASIDLTAVAYLAGQVRPIW